MKEQHIPLTAVAEVLQINRSTLQYYIAAGLIKPSTAFPKSKMRLFNVKDVDNIYRKIKKMQTLGYKLQEICKKLEAAVK